MTSATRRAVQTSPRKPYVSAPFAKSWGICAFCSSVKRGFIPCGGCALRASTPCSRPRLSQWLTAPSLTPRATAMSFCFQPCSFKLQARLRRSSRQSAFLGAPMPPSLQHLYFLLPRSVSYARFHHWQNLRLGQRGSENLELPYLTTTPN